VNPGRWLRNKSIFRKTSIIFVVVSLVPIAILALRCQQVYTEQLAVLVNGGVITAEEADSQAHGMIVEAVTYGGYGLLIALVLGYFFASGIVRPIRALQQGARRIGDGNLSYRVATDTEGELEELATTINQMAESLQARETEIYRRNRDLSLLYKVAHIMAESRDQSDLLNNALDKAMEITGSATGCVLLLSDEGILEPVIRKGYPEDAEHGLVRESFKRAAEICISSGSPSLIDYHEEPSQADDAAPTAIACVQLKFEGELRGAICVACDQEDYLREKQYLISAIGNEVAVAIENARLLEKLESQNRELALATSEIASLIRRAEEERSFGIRYQNPELVRCWELKNCQHTDCPAYDSSENLRCWQIAGTHCSEGEVAPGVFSQKLKQCDKCEVFLAACPDKITHLGETFNNMMAVLERRFEEQEELQRQLASSSKLAAIGELAAGVAHEINNPLTGILASALLMKSQPQDVETAQKKLTVIESEALRARDIVRSLLDFAHHGDSGSRSPIAVDSLLEQTLFLLGHQSDLGAVSVQADFEPELPEVVVDANQMKQVFLNISSNAIQSMAGTGRLTVRAAKSRAGEDQTVEISFTDTGSGMDDAAISRIFDPFFTTKRVGEGTGLGLSVSQRIVSEHGGEILVDSSLGAGSTFTVVLPAREAGGEAAENVA